MKILIHSNAPWAGTGYGQQAGLLASLLKAAGHDVAISAFYGLSGAKLVWNDMPVYPCWVHPYGNDVILHHAADHFGGDARDGLIITLVDVWVLDAPSLSRANVACWVPIDHDPAPPAVVNFLEASGATPIAMSRHGERQLEAAGLSPLYAPHGIDTNCFKPADKSAARERFGFPQDAFLVAMVAANKGYPARKGFDQAIAAFARFLDRHDDAYLYLHSEQTPLYGGVDLAAILAAHDVPPCRAFFVDRYRNMLGIPADVVAAVYNAADVLLNPAHGEGFGIPIVEAQACGTPVIATDWTAMSELVGAGWLVDGERVFTNQGAFQKMPSADGILAALEQAYSESAGMRERAVEFAAAYDARRVYAEHWAPMLETLTERPEFPGVVQMPAAEAEAA